MALARRLLGARYIAAERGWRRLRRRVIPDERRRVRLQRQFAARHGLVVRGGPFRDMVYVDETLHSRFGFNLAARLLGSYEAELQEIVETVISSRYDTILDIGSGDGYYAVGLALRIPGCTVDAFDPDPAARWLCEKVAEANRVLGRVIIKSGATSDDLRAHRDGRVFAKIDCEGCELAVLQPAESEVLRAATILVELHDFLHHGTTSEILSRFSPTHDGQVVECRPRSRGDYPELESFADEDAAILLSERRPPSLRWAFLTPRPQPSARTLNTT
ncbi:MAG: hypothetical protein HW413_1073 [Thermoleophilia bacterium]|nr:hypothetical protein [Thermoleophilia bacterium]